MFTAIHTAKLNWDPSGMPQSESFDDIYFSTENGLQETRYVFIERNSLAQRWPKHDRPFFTIGETGFGTGLNFLATWQAFRLYQQQHPDGNTRRLYYISTEKFPLAQSDLEQALRAWPELTEFAQALVAQYPLPTAGCHRLIFDDGQIMLDLWLGDVHDSLPQMPVPAHGLIDAWFLDGFAPSKNPDMWNEHLFSELFRLARPEATLATFTCAGFVRRGLQAAGFIMSKQPGFGKKREMLTGQKTLLIDTEHQASLDQPNTNKPAETNKEAYQETVTPSDTSAVSAPAPLPEAVTILGGGIASAWLTYFLCRRGIPVTLFCADKEVAQSASGNPQGAVYPLLQPTEPLLSQWSAAAFQFARHQLINTPLKAQIEQDWQGVIHVASSTREEEKQRQLAAAEYPSELVQLTRSGICFPLGGWISPVQAVEQLFALAAQTGLFTLYKGRTIEAFTFQHHQWLFTDTAGKTGTASHLVLANGAKAHHFAQTHQLPITPTRGQITLLNQDPAFCNQREVLCGCGGYIVPASHDQQVIGATYQRYLDNEEPTPADNDANVQAALKLIQQFSHRNSQTVHAAESAVQTESISGYSNPLQDLANVSICGARAAVRAMSRDHFPFVGPYRTGHWQLAWEKQPRNRAEGPSLPEPQTPSADYLWQSPDDLWIHSGFGARGLCHAALAAEILACQLSGEPIPAPIHWLEAMFPQRRELKTLRKTGFIYKSV